MARRRGIAGLFALVLLVELAVLCCVLGHASEHGCAGHEACAVCDYLRLCLRESLALPAAALILLGRALSSASKRVHRRRAPLESLFALRVRLND